MKQLTQQQAKNALARIKIAINADNEKLAIIYIQRIFECGFHNGMNSVFEAPEDDF